MHVVTAAIVMEELGASIEADDSLLTGDSNSIALDSLGAQSSFDEHLALTGVQRLIASPSPPPVSLLNDNDLADAPSPTFLPFGKYSDLVLGLLLILVLHNVYKKHKAVVTNLLTCLLSIFAIGPLRAPINSFLDGMHRSVQREQDTGIEIAWSNEDDLETGRVDGSTNDDEASATMDSVEMEPIVRSKKRHGRRPRPRPHRRAADSDEEGESTLDGRAGRPACHVTCSSRDLRT